jgi:hypothetical protein
LPYSNIVHRARRSKLRRWEVGDIALALREVTPLHGHVLVQRVFDAPQQRLLAPKVIVALEGNVS